MSRINLKEVDFAKRRIRTIEKGSREGISAIGDYIHIERLEDEAYFDSPALFLPAPTVANAKNHLTPQTINGIWNQVCKASGVSGKTPHSARHGMGRHILEKTHNIAAVQRQLNHTNAAYSLQYSRITSVELAAALDDR